MHDTTNNSLLPIVNDAPHGSVVFNNTLEGNVIDDMDIVDDTITVENNIDIDASPIPTLHIDQE